MANTAWSPASHPTPRRTSLFVAADTPLTWTHPDSSTPTQPLAKSSQPPSTLPSNNTQPPTISPTTLANKTVAPTALPQIKPIPPIKPTVATKYPIKPNQNKRQRPLEDDEENDY